MSSQRLIQLFYYMFERSRPILCIEFEKNILLSQCKSVAQNISNNKQTKKHFHLVMIHWIFGIAIYLYILCNYIHGSAFLEGGYTMSNLDCSDDQSPHLGNQGAIKIISYVYFLNQIVFKY